MQRSVYTHPESTEFLYINKAGVTASVYMVCVQTAVVFGGCCAMYSFYTLQLQQNACTQKKGDDAWL
jgi:hypothetical protein